MPDAKQLEGMGKDIADEAEAIRKLIEEQFKGLGPYTRRIKDAEYPFWWESMQRKALEEQLAGGIIGWKWPDGVTTLGAWDRVMESGAVEGGREEAKRYARTRAEQQGMTEVGNVPAS